MRTGEWFRNQTHNIVEIFQVLVLQQLKTELGLWVVTHKPIKCAECFEIPMLWCLWKTRQVKLQTCVEFSATTIWKLLNIWGELEFDVLRQHYFVLCAIWGDAQLCLFLTVCIWAHHPGSGIFLFWAWFQALEAGLVIQWFSDSFQHTFFEMINCVLSVITQFWSSLAKSLAMQGLSGNALRFQGEHWVSNHSEVNKL